VTRRLLILLALVPALAATALASSRSTVEAAFSLPSVHGNPFDFLQNDVKVTFVSPDGGRITVPAYFDGGATWRARHAADLPGRWTVDAVTLNGTDAKPTSIDVRVPDAVPHRRPRFIRIDPDNRKRFIFDDGSPFYPLGFNLAWRYPRMTALPESLARMGAAGVNWTRIWMNHWDGKNLDWPMDRNERAEPGHISLVVAKAWDEIVAAAEESGVHLQLVLQHHGQYNTKDDSNWATHPWNKTNGGWLASPVEFFSDPRAVALTKAKYRYAIARWGHSPAVMAWELFNEVEHTDAFEEDLPAVARWHAEMAAFLREHDPYRHLVTTSSRTTEPSLWPAMDFYQSHVYPPDLLTAVQALDAERLDRPYFYGEIGGSAHGPQADAAGDLHRALWASLMSRSAGAAQYWFWERVESDGLLPRYTAARGFLKQSGLLDAHHRMAPIDVTVDTPNRVPLRFGPGMGWAPSKQTKFAVNPGGLVQGLGGMSAYLQGPGANHAMFPFAELLVHFDAPGTFAVRIDEMTVHGARLEISLDGGRSATLDLGPAPAPVQRPGAPATRTGNRNVRVDATLEIPVPAGDHTIRLENAGPQWARIREFTLSPYAAELGSLAKGNDTAAVVWTYRRQPTTGGGPVSGTISIPGLNEGTYEVVWWDTHAGKRVAEELVRVNAATPLNLRTPPIARDLAIWVRRIPK
jgi:hypothetical protein